MASHGASMESQSSTASNAGAATDSSADPRPAPSSKSAQAFDFYPGLWGDLPYGSAFPPWNQAWPSNPYAPWGFPPPGYYQRQLPYGHLDPGGSHLMHRQQQHLPRPPTHPDACLGQVSVNIPVLKDIPFHEGDGDH